MEPTNAGVGGGGAGGVGLVGSVPINTPGSHIQTASSAEARSGFVTAGHEFSTGSGARGFVNTPTLSSGGAGGSFNPPVVMILVLGAIAWLLYRWMK